MTVCGTGTLVNSGLCGENDIINIGCLPQTTGEPSQAPLQDQLPIAIDTNGQCIWYYLCDTNTWTRICPGTICGLEEVDLSMIADICNILNLPVRYEMNDTCVEGVVSLSSFAEVLRGCLGNQPVIIHSVFNAGNIWVTPTAPSFNGPNFLIDSKELIDSGPHLPGSGIIVVDPAFTFSNPTNNAGVLTLITRVVHRRSFIDGLGNPLPIDAVPVESIKIFTSTGKPESINQGTLNHNALSTDADFPLGSLGTTVDIRNLNIKRGRGDYNFTHAWTIGTLEFRDVKNDSVVSLSNTYVLAPGESIDLSSRVALGMIMNPLGDNNSYVINYRANIIYELVFQGTT